MCTMDAGVERPELRTFTKNILEVAKRNAARCLVVAALTCCARGMLSIAASKSLNLPALGSFEDWSARIREPLVWLDKIDPCETLAETRDNDPHRGELIAVIMQWKQHLVLDQKYTVQELIGRAVNVPDFHNALVAVAMARTGGMISNASLGRWLKRVQKQIVNGLTLLQDGNAHGYPQWKLTRR